MSATNRGAKRAEADFYPTPAWCVHRLLEAVSFPGGQWLEPAAGDGAIIKAVSQKRRDVHWDACDIRPEAKPLLEALEPTSLTIGDARGLMVRTRRAVCITNPPYSLAQDFIELGLRTAYRVALLLRLNYLGSAERSEFLRANTPSIYVLPNRPSFTGGKTDACEYAWFVWYNGMAHPDEHPTVQILDLTPKKERCP